MDMAKKASLNLKDNWHGYPRAMLASRAKSELARDVYPDVLAGVFTQDEIESGPVATAPPTRHGNTPDVLDAEILSETPAERPPWLLAIGECETEAALQEMAPNLAKLVGDEKAAAKKAYADRLGLIRKLGGRAPAVPAPPTGTTCSECHEPQVRTSCGDTCQNNHGGADPPQPAPVTTEPTS